MKKISFICSIMFVLSSCATMFNGTTQNINVMTSNGDIVKAQTALDTAKEQMKELSEKYSDYEHYPNLKGCYVATNTFFEFCQNPACSLIEFETTLNDYKEETSDYINNLDYIFEE